MNLSVQFDDAITRDQTLRVGVLPERQHRRQSRRRRVTICRSAPFPPRTPRHTFRIQEAGPLGRRFFINTPPERQPGAQRTARRARGADHPRQRRVHQRRRPDRRRPRLDASSTSPRISTTCAASIRSGLGVVLEGGRVTLDADVELPGHLHVREPGGVRGRAAAQLHRAHRRSRASTTATSRAAIYMQDDIRVRSGLTLSPGRALRAADARAATARTSGRGSASPGRRSRAARRRCAAAPASSTTGSTSSPTSRRCRVDGFRQRELNISNPSYPDPGTRRRRRRAAGQPLPVGPAIGRCRRNVRFTGAADQAITPQLRLGVVYNYMRRESIGRGLNLNAPVDGVRPDPAVRQHHRGRVGRERAPAHHRSQLSDRRAAAAGSSDECPEDRLETRVLHRSVHVRRLATTTSRASSARRRPARSRRSGARTRTMPATV